jgi:hypothetical protein
MSAQSNTEAVAAVFCGLLYVTLISCLHRPSNAYQRSRPSRRYWIELGATLRRRPRGVAMELHLIPRIYKCRTHDYDLSAEVRGKVGPNGRPLAISVIGPRSPTARSPFG